MDNLKVGEVIVFTKDINAGYERDHVLLIPANQNCTIIKINYSHITVKFGNIEEKLRNIPNRMQRASELAQVIYGS